MYTDGMSSMFLIRAYLLLPYSDLSMAGVQLCFVLIIKFNINRFVFYDILNLYLSILCTIKLALKSSIIYRNNLPSSCIHLINFRISHKNKMVAFPPKLAIPKIIKKNMLKSRSDQYSSK